MRSPNQRCRLRRRSARVEVGNGFGWAGLAGLGGCFAAELDQLGIGVDLWGTAVVGESQVRNCVDVAGVEEARSFVLVLVVAAHYYRVCCMVVDGIVAGMEVGLVEVVADRLEVEVVDFLAFHGLYPCSIPQPPYFMQFLGSGVVKMILQF